MSDAMNLINWFEIPANDLNRAKDFYENVFGLEITIQEFGGLKMGWFPFEEGAAGATGTLIENEGYVPSHDGTMIYFSVKDIEGTLDKVNGNNGTVITEKMSIGEYGFVGHFEDSEGNRVGLHSHE